MSGTDRLTTSGTGGVISGQLYDLRAYRCNLFNELLDRMLVLELRPTALWTGSGAESARRSCRPPTDCRGGNSMNPRWASLFSSNRADMSLSCPFAVRQLRASHRTIESRRRLQ